jgi:Reverse transcriptase (RNA-dependent DNA polymerase)
MAYLNADMEKEVFMRISPQVARILCGVRPEYKQFLMKNGGLVVRLKKALYGCLESANLWYKDLSQTLMGLGFKPNLKQRCVFNTMRNGHQVSVCIYVDDLMVTSIDPKDLDWVREELILKYKELTWHGGKVHSYLGQRFDFSVDGQCNVDMTQYVEEMMAEYDVKGFRVTPAQEGLYEIDPESPRLDQERSDEFRSRVMKVMFACLRARPDVLTAVSFLDKRFEKCTDQDWDKLERLLMYLNSTKNLGIVLKATEGIRVIAHIDASFASHADYKGHTGAFITMGSGPFFVGSKKQSLVTKASAECELVGLSDFLPMVIWFRDFLIQQGYEVKPATVYQDNMSTIALAKRGYSNSQRTRHIAIRYFWIKDRIDSSEVSVEHMPGEKIIADGLSKPLQGDGFRVSRSAIMGL